MYRHQGDLPGPAFWNRKNSLLCLMNENGGDAVLQRLGFSSGMDGGPRVGYPKWGFPRPGCAADQGGDVLPRDNFNYGAGKEDMRARACTWDLEMPSTASRRAIGPRESGSPQPSARDWTTRLWEKGAPERCFCPNSRRLPCGRRLHDRAGPALSRKAAPRQRSRALCGLVRTPSKRNRQEYDAHMVAARELGMKWAMGW